MTKHNLVHKLAVVLILELTINLFISCSGNTSKEPAAKQTFQKYDGVTIEVDNSNKNCLAILLANDGTINRKGNSHLDPKDKNLFMGLTKSKPFDSLMNEISNELLQHCNSPSPQCDTLKQNCKAKIAFGNKTSSCEIEYCVNGTFDNLPQPIKDFIKKSIEVTEPWYQEQQKLLHEK